MNRTRAMTCADTRGGLVRAWPNDTEGRALVARTLRRWRRDGEAIRTGGGTYRHAVTGLRLSTLRRWEA